jgi:hypothetical protein
MDSPTPHQPPWQVFPYPWGSIGYRMGRGEEHWEKFADWFRALTPEARINFAVDNPEPADWRYFYEYICLDRNDEAGWDRLYPLIQANWREYQAAEYDHGRVAEDAGNLPAALCHYWNALQHGDFRDVADRYDHLRRVLRGESDATPRTSSSDT